MRMNCKPSIGTTALSPITAMFFGRRREEGIEASYKDGVLQVNIPKSETTRQKKIEVKSE